MSPILKRNAADHVRAIDTVSKLVGLDNSDYRKLEGEPSGGTGRENGRVFGSASSSCVHAGLEEPNVSPSRARESSDGHSFGSQHGDRREDRHIVHGPDVEHVPALVVRANPQSFYNTTSGSGRRGRAERGRTTSEWLRLYLLDMSPSRWMDLRNLLLEVCHSPCVSGLSRFRTPKLNAIRPRRLYCSISSA